MENKNLFAISPVDGRYADKTQPLTQYYSEFALIQKRVHVEVEYFIALCDLNIPFLADFPKEKYTDLRKIYQSFTEKDAQRIKDIEKTTNHDVKAVEYFLKEKWDALKLSKYKEYIHFGLTSQDINNTSYPMCIRDSVHEVMIPKLGQIQSHLLDMAKEYSQVPMLARTHGQPASPTLLGKEIYVFYERLSIQLEQLKTIKFSGKLGGATGNFNAHHVVFPNIAWDEFANNFLKNQLGIERQQTTTQIEHYDGLAELSHIFIRINTILVDLCRDLWTYISMDYFKQKINPNEVGSSAMPHKVNPIDFENAEGNLAYANAIFEFLAQKLPISRLQRDLTDSTVLRNFGTPVSNAYIAYLSILKGLSKLTLNPSKISDDLDQNWSVVAEAIQTYLRSINYPNPYETLKSLTRTNQVVNQASIHAFVDELSISDVDKKLLKKISPSNYFGTFFKI